MQKHSSPQPSSWCAWFLVLLLTAGTIRTTAQAPAHSKFDRLVASAENGDAAAQVELGVLYYRGVADNHRPDYAEAQDRIGVMYYYGQGVPQDYAQAAHWYQLAAQGGDYHARLQLSGMYQRGVGVPRDASESRKWSRLANGNHPNHESVGIWMSFAIAVLAVIAFSLGLVALHRNVLTGRQQLLVAVFVHLAGVALVLNTLTTYGFGIVFPHCSHSFLATDCTQISDPHTRAIVSDIGDWAVVNLIFRFMAGVGLVLDALAVWYVVYLCRLVFRRPRVQVPSPVPSRNV
jgi:hypothetical protein